MTKVTPIFFAETQLPVEHIPSFNGFEYGAITVRGRYYPTSTTDSLTRLLLGAHERGAILSTPSGEIPGQHFEGFTMMLRTRDGIPVQYGPELERQRDLLLHIRYSTEQDGKAAVRQLEEGLDVLGITEYPPLRCDREERTAEDY